MGEALRLAVIAALVVMDMDQADQTNKINLICCEQAL
jgi:hypothetical protein